MVNLELWNAQKKKLKLTLSDIASKTKISISAVKDIFRGATTDPRLETVQAIERVLGLTTEETQKSPQDELSEGEKMLLDLFNRVPEDKQELVLQMIQVALKSQE